MNTQEYKICSRCILTEDLPDVHLDEKGVCNYCRGELPPEKVHQTHSKRNPRKQEKYRKHFERLMKTLAERDDPYHAVLALSGGKDSISLYTLLTETYGLRVKAVMVDMGFESDIAVENIRRLRQKTDIDVEVVRMPENFSYKFYRLLFAEAEKHPEEDMMKIVCGHCHPLLLSTVIRYAHRLGVKYVFGGQSPDETNTFYYRLPRWMIKLFTIPSLIRKSGLFSDEELDLFWDGRKYKFKEIPHYYAPYHVLPYNADRIRASLAERDLLPLTNTNPALTNCKILNYMVARALEEGKPLPYVYNIADQVREGHLSRDAALEIVDLAREQAMAIHDEVAKKLNLNNP